MTDELSYDDARRRVLKLKGFYIHLAAFVLVNLLLLFINLMTSPGRLWFYWPLLGWGIGLVAHGVSVFGGAGYLGKDWEERKIRELMARSRGKGGKAPGS